MLEKHTRNAGAVHSFFEPVVWPEDAEAAVEFLASNEWPYHGRPNLSRQQAAEVSLAGDDIVSFWVKAGSEAVGLIRVFDLEDLDVGSPLLDIRIAAARRGRGLGTSAVSWLWSICSPLTANCTASKRRLVTTTCRCSGCSTVAGSGSRAECWRPGRTLMDLERTRGPTQSFDESGRRGDDALPWCEA